MIEEVEDLGVEPEDHMMRQRNLLGYVELGVCKVRTAKLITA